MRPASSGSSCPTDRAIAAKELETSFAAPLLVGPARMVKQPGDWVAMTLVDTPVGGQTDAVGALERVAEVAARRSLVVLLTDGFDFNSPGRMAAVARQLRRRNHRVVVFQILDPDEVDFPFKDLTVFEDMEVADDRALADPRGMREAYLDEIRAYSDGLKRDLLEGDVGYRRVVTSTPLDRTIIDALGGRA